MFRLTIGRAIASAIAGGVLVAAAAAQPGHIHDRHPTTVHDTNWVRTGLDSNWVGPPNVTGTGPTEELLFQRTFENATCDPVTITVSETFTRTHTVTLSGTITVGGSVEAAAGVLFSSLKATAHASVAFSGSNTSTNTVSYTISETTVNPKCHKKHFKATLDAYSSSGTIDCADHRITCTQNGTGRTAINWCNKTSISGSGKGWESGTNRWSDLGDITPCPCCKKVVENMAGDGSQIDVIDECDEVPVIIIAPDVAEQR